MNEQREILNSTQLEIIIKRLSQELIESHQDFSNSVIVSLQPRGKYLAKRIISCLSENFNINSIDSGDLDISFYRDDLLTKKSPIITEKINMDITVDNKRVILIDDVLFTARSVRAAMDAVMPFGRPKSIELLVLIDRRLSRHIPIQPNYVGKIVDAIDSERVVVDWLKKRLIYNGIRITVLSSLNYIYFWNFTKLLIV